MRKVDFDIWHGLSEIVRYLNICHGICPASILALGAINFAQIGTRTSFFLLRRGFHSGPPNGGPFGINGLALALQMIPS
jgi:hypothetical protein